MYAVLIGNTTILEMLLENGADPSIENEVGLKARDYANNYPQMIKLLQEYEGKVINDTNRPIFVPLFKVYLKLKIQHVWPSLNCKIFVVLVILRE